MLALGYTIAGILLGVTFLVALATCVGLWLGIRSMRPEALEPGRGGDAGA